MGLSQHDEKAGTHEASAAVAAAGVEEEEEEEEEEEGKASSSTASAWRSTRGSAIGQVESRCTGGVAGACHFIEKECQHENLLAMKFTALHNLYR